jgi:hypothetical protein
MVLTNVGISILRGNKELWQAVRKELKVGPGAMYQYVRSNDPILTQAGALKVLREGTGLTDSELLDGESVGTINESHKANS